MRRELIDNNPSLKLSFEFSLLVIDYSGTLDAKKNLLFQNNYLNQEHL
jgi:hypothetical protein